MILFGEESLAQRFTQVLRCMKMVLLNRKSKCIYVFLSIRDSRIAFCVQHPRRKAKCRLTFSDS